MAKLDRPLSPEGWMRDLFGSRTAIDGGVVRRKISDMERYVGRERFAAELRRRGFRALQNAGQVVVFCNRDPIRPFPDAGNGVETDTLSTADRRRG